jgi:hypothetical protein
MAKDGDLVERLCAIESGLTPWEVEFAESVAHQAERGFVLSDKQREKIEDILERLEH